jgi:hypothetical protein
MANLRFHNDTASLNHLWYESHKNLITSLCIEFDKTDDIDAMIAKFLCAPIKMKALKDPNKPKRAKSAYLFYCADHRPKILEKLRKKKQKINIADVSKKLGAMWGTLDDKTKAPYTKSAEKDRNRYKDEMEQYNA